MNKKILEGNTMSRKRRGDRGFVFHRRVGRKQKQTPCPPVLFRLFTESSFKLNFGPTAYIGVFVSH